MAGRRAVVPFCSMAARDVTRVGGGNLAQRGGARELHETARQYRTGGWGDRA